MDPYIHAAGGRGEGFRVDDIHNIDEFAQQQYQIEEALGKKGRRKKKRGGLLRMVRNIFKK